MNICTENCIYHSVWFDLLPQNKQSHQDTESWFPTVPLVPHSPVTTSARLTTALTSDTRHCTLLSPLISKPWKLSMPAGKIWGPQALAGTILVRFGLCPCPYVIRYLKIPLLLFCTSFPFTLFENHPLPVSRLLSHDLNPTTPLLALSSWTAT